MSSRPNSNSVVSVSDLAARPFWSVMIPTFNCASYLRETLASVLAQAPGPDEMQIEVVDDCSTKDDPEVVVREIGKGRVDFHRHPRNLGLTANWNECLNRARGHWVHLLHGDDLVLPGFYREMSEAAERHPQASIIFCRALTIDEQGELESLSPRMRELERGGSQFSPMHLENPVRTPAVVVRRSFYERHGGFDPRFSHTADWEMWMRATTLGGAVAVNKALAAYRLFSTNHSSRLARSAGNVEEYLQLAKAAESEGRTTVDWPKFHRMLAACAAAQARTFAALGDNDAAAANWKFWSRVVTWKGRAELFARRVLTGGR